ncbi:MAG: lamin tail domain-containing protein [Verrucomicrobia bacterium]|nr:lamin tail domain-containing protein [Verrucomicrobiota bacterium]
MISEVMYHPTNRLDGRNLEFIEIYNSQPWFEELGGWRISGAIDYTFPSNIVLQSKQYLVVAANPADFRATYSFTNVFGPFSNSNGLQNSSGSLRLRNASGAVLFEMEYTGDPPYSAAADGAGHSLVLARPSYGERDPRAWDISNAVGGNPGNADLPSTSAYRTVMINEILAHTDLPDLDFVELYNYGNSTVSIGGVILTDDPETNKFVVPTGTQIPPGGFVVFTETQLGFGLSSGGETIFMKHPSGQRVLDAVRFEAQENGVSLGRTPDGASQFSRLLTPTPGTNNAVSKPTEIVINEIMFDPISGDADDEYVELFNRGTNLVNLSGWRLRDGVSFDFPDGTTIAPGAYLVVARNAARLRANYPQLTTLNCVGDYEGSLANGGERIELNFPDEVVSLNAQGQPRTNIIHITHDDVRYDSGGRWGQFSAGGGSSLELRDAHSDNRLAPNWADSDESSKSPWVNVEFTGVMDNGWADAYQLHVTLLGAGEALIDNIEVIPAGGANVIANGTFESGTTGWVFQGNHNDSRLETAEGFGSSRSLRMRTTGRGDAGANRIRTQLPSTLAPGTTVTLRAKVRWLKGNPNVLLRLRGNWLEAPGYVLTAKNLGSPGLPNSRGVANSGPAITDTRHEPALPNAAQSVLVTARVNDPDGISYLVVNYRVDPSTNYLTLPMTNNSAGIFSAVIPGQAAGATVAFFVQAADNFAPPGFSAFPSDAPLRECVIRWGDTTILGSLPTYRFWITATNVARWMSEEKMSNKPKDVTFIYGTNRVVYNAGAWFHGSPYHSPVYDSPTGTACDYDLNFPDDDLLLGESDINLFRPGNGGGDGQAQREIHAYWFGYQFGIPFLYHRPVFVFVNGQRRETVFHDAQQPNGDFVDQWFPDDANGDLHKIMLGFEFGDQAYGASEPGYAVVGANLARYTTTGGVKKQARYRATWPRRSASLQELNDYTNIFNLVEVTLTNAPIGSDAYTAALSSTFDVEEWYKVNVAQHMFWNPDSYSYGGGQNAFAYKPERDGWKLFLWDVDFAFGGAANDSNLTGIGGADHGPRNDHPPFARIYWQAIIEAANGMMTPARSDTILDARYNGMVAGGAAVASPLDLKNWIAARRSYVLTQIAANQSSFAITSNGGADFATNRNLITLTGTAPLEVRTILVNGVPFPVTWTALNTWVIRIPLTSGLNTLVFSGRDPKGNLVPGVAGTIRVTYTGANELPQDKVVINEIMYNPLYADASFVEIHNTSVSNAFDLSGWKLDGAGFVFPNGSVLEPGAFKLIVVDATIFAETYGPSLAILGEMSGKLDNGGETLTLVKPGANPELDAIVDQVTYDDDLPWPASADGLGSSLQLIDPLRDNNRSANWAAVTSGLTNAPQTLVVMTNVWRYQTNSAFPDTSWTTPVFDDFFWLTGRGLLYYEDAALPEPKNTQIARGRTTYYFRTKFNFSGSTVGAGLKLFTILDDGAIFYLNGQELYRQNMPAGPVTYDTFASPGVGDATLTGPFIVPATALVNGENTIAVEVHQQNGTSSDVVFGLSLETTYDLVSRYTPGLVNSTRSTLPTFPTVWLNEIMPTNFFLGTNGITDRFGEHDPWVELYNGGTNSLSLDGYFLANNYTNLTQWAFPVGATIGPKQFLVVWLDGEPAESIASELHANFRPMEGTGSVVLSKGATLASIVDYLNYSIPVVGRTYGSYPDGSVSGRRSFSVVTPGATNNPAAAPVAVKINEWMADNVLTLADPADADFEDWFELYNPETNAVNLTGYFLADSATNATQWAIPAGTTIPAKGYLLVWADNEATQNSASRADIHAAFSLAKGGEAIALFAPDGTLIDVVTFGPQTTDVSEGRFVDGAQSIYAMTNATPRSANFLFSPNTPPVVGLISDKTVDEGGLLSFVVSATDADLPAQTLTFALAGIVPEGASLDSTNGLFRWKPIESQGPRNYALAVVVFDSGAPSLSATQTFNVTVREVNNAPVLAPLTSRTVNEGVTLSVTNSATDPDGLGQSLTFSLDAGAPVGMVIDAVSGVLVWTPSEEQGPGTYSVTVRVTDNGDPAMSSTESLSVFVAEINSEPELGIIPNVSVAPGRAVMFTVAGTDSDFPAQSLTFSLAEGAPAGATIDLLSGTFEWSTDISFARTTNVVTVTATDSGVPRLSASRTFSIVVTAELQAQIAKAGNDVIVSAEVVTGRTYRLEFKDSLDAPDWLPLGDSAVAATTTISFSDSPGANVQRFYRVVQVD